jgi:hypothetical protein
MSDSTQGWKDNDDDDVVMIYTCEECGNRTLTIPSVCPKCKKIVKNQSITKFVNKIEILADVWKNHRSEEEMIEFCETNDVGLPLAFVLSNNLAIASDLGEQYINESFDALLTFFEVDKDYGFESINDIFDAR